MESLCCTPEANTTLSTNHRSIKQINKEQRLESTKMPNHLQSSLPEISYWAPRRHRRWKVYKENKEQNTAPKTKGFNV